MTHITAYPLLDFSSLSGARVGSQGQPPLVTFNVGGAPTYRFCTTMDKQSAPDVCLESGQMCRLGGAQAKPCASNDLTKLARA